jgi:ABC-2 type transport system permease protein
MNRAADLPLKTEAMPRRGGFDVSALAALFVLTVRQNIRGRRLLILSLLFLLPSLLVGVARFAPFTPPPDRLEFNFIFLFIPHALVPLTALLYAAGMIQDEVEEQTLTYLLLRPLPRWALYIVRLAAIWLVTALLTAVFTTITFIVVWWGTEQLWGEIIPVRAAKTAGLLALVQLGYCSVFAALGLLTRRSLMVGLAYIVCLEGLMANIPFVLRQFTVMYYFRVLAIRWLAPADKSLWLNDWSFKIDEIPYAGQCVQTLLIASAVLTLLGVTMIMGREFRMKTPEGS